MLHIIKDIFTRPQVRPLGAALLLATALTACEDQLPTVDTSAGNGPTLTLCIDNEEEDPATRTSLDNADPTHHVKAVKILIFKGRGDDATYLDQETLTWTADVDGNRVDRKEYTLQHLFTEEGDYTLLGVGMDAATDDAFNYDFKDASNPGNPTELTAGTTTLANAYACLKDGKSPADCEFFTGTVSFTYRKNHNIEVDDLLMRRRVAGVMLYVTDIPQNLYPTNGDNTVEYRTTKIYVKAGRVQKKSVRLQRDFNDPEAWDEPEGTPLYDEANATDEQKILLELDLTELVKYDKNTTGNETYTIPTTDNHLANTLYTSCYMLPLNAEENNTNYKTFSVEIWGVENADGTGSTLTEGTPKEEALLKTFYVENKSQATDKTKYDIRSNYIYCIGKNWEGTENDQPVSLLGENIYLDVLAWTDIEQDVTFEPARIQAIFNPDFDEERYRFNCINNEFTVEILPSMNHEQWRIVIPSTTTVVKEDGGGTEVINNMDWLYIKTGENQYEKQYQPDKVSCEKAATVTFLMMDYAVQRPWGWTNNKWDGDATDIDLINNDVRSIKVLLHTLDDNNNVSRTDELTITQYNTITVNYKSPYGEDNEIATCGFSRVDLGDCFNKFPPESGDEVMLDTELIESDKMGGHKSTGWGWENSPATWLYPSTGGKGSRTDGAKNIKQLGKDRNEYADEWKPCASAKSEVLFVEVKNGQKIIASYNAEHTTDACWYLPAEYEMEGLFRAYLESNKDLNCNLTQSFWWTSTTDYIEGTTYVAKAIQPLYRGYVLKAENSARTNGKFERDETPQIGDMQMYVRQARKFDDYYNNGN